jgi:hypothetical protein
LVSKEINQLFERVFKLSTCGLPCVLFGRGDQFRKVVEQKLCPVCGNKHKPATESFHPWCWLPKFKATNELLAEISAKKDFPAP